MSRRLFLALFVSAALAPCSLAQAPCPGKDWVRVYPPVVVESRSSPADKKPDMVLRWNQLALDAIRAERTPPPVAARNLAIVHTAIYDAVNSIRRTHAPYRFQVLAAPDASAEAAVAVAAYRALEDLYPRQRKTLDEALAASLAEIADPHARKAGAYLGEFVADKMLEWRAQDAACFLDKHALHKKPGAWQPTAPAHTAALLPGWVNLTPFGIREGILPRPKGPPPLSSAAHALALAEVRELGGKDSPKRSPEQTQIAHFWADGEGTSTPAGHWNRIAQDAALAKGATLEENARLFALLNISLADAALACWIIKFHHDFWRPITAIRRADEDDNPVTLPDPDWTPLLPTPPFPAYTSGHSTFSAAAATTLAHFFGTDKVAFDTTSEGLPGIRRSFTSFWSAAEEAGQSRIYGGIHYAFDNTDGLTIGRAVGDYVWRNHLKAR